MDVACGACCSRALMQGRGVFNVGRWESCWIWSSRRLKSCVIFELWGSNIGCSTVILCVIGPISYKTIDLEVALVDLAPKSTKAPLSKPSTGFQPLYIVRGFRDSVCVCVCVSVLFTFLTPPTSSTREKAAAKHIISIHFLSCLKIRIELNEQFSVLISEWVSE